ncbi:putative nucleoid-associated protein [Burkholderia cepacia]|nr:putative nucleoid-associated protein [Burkholderia cepacia]
MAGTRRVPVFTRSRRSIPMLKGNLAGLMKQAQQMQET